MRLSIIFAALALTCTAAVVVPGDTVAAGGAPAAQESELNPLTGTYREKESKDEEIGRKVLALSSRMERADRERMAKEFFKVLSSEPLFAIEQYATTFTINYPAGRRVPFEADGRVRHFRVKGAGRLSLRAVLEGRRLTVDFTWPEGDRLSLIYEKSADGRHLTFTRRAATRAVPLPVSVTSEYELVSPRATRNFDGLLRR